MVTYSLETVTALLDQIQKVSGRPNFSSLWLLAEAISDALRKLNHPDHPTDGWSGCMLTPEEFALRSILPWTPPEAMGRYFVMPTAAITSGDQEQAKGEYKYKRDLLDTFETINMALKTMFERVIDKAYHTTGNTGIMGNGFGQLTPFEILQRLRTSYGQATIEEVEAKLNLLQNPMDRNLPIEVMIKDLEDVQRFLLANPEEKMELTEVQLITRALIKLSKTGGLYSRATERWKAKELAERQVWMNFKTHYIGEYEKMLAAGGGTTMAQEGYSGAYNVVEDDASSLAESIVQYAERATTAESKVSDLESRLAALEMGPPPAPPQTAYHMPHHMAYYGQGPPPPPSAIHMPPPHWQSGQEQNNGGKRNNTDYQRGGQRRRTNNYQGGRGRGYGGGRGQGSNRNANNEQRKYSNTAKQHLNLLYCYSCGYDVDHDGYNCPPSSQKLHHLPHVKRDDAHLYRDACMKAQHKTLPDGSGAGRGWIMMQNMEKGRFVLAKREAWKQQQGGQQTWQRPPPPPQQQQQQQWQPQQQAHNAWQTQPPPPPPQYGQQAGQYQQYTQQPPQGYQQYWGGSQYGS